MVIKQTNQIKTSLIRVYSINIDSNNKSFYKNNFNKFMKSLI